MKKSLQDSLNESFVNEAKGISEKEAKIRFANSDAPLMVGMDLDGFGHVKSITALDSNLNKIAVTFFDIKQTVTLEWESVEKKWTEHSVK